MKLLFTLILPLMLAACATPFYPVYTSNDGAYYITEKQSGGLVYGSNATLTSEILSYPWWMEGYRADLFVYYSPNYYPYYFSVSNPVIYNPFYGFYRRHHVYWCPPYLYPGSTRVVAEPAEDAAEDRVVGSSRRPTTSLPPSVLITSPAPFDQFRRNLDLARQGPYGSNLGAGKQTGARQAGSSFRSIPSTGGTSRQSSYRATSSRPVSRARAPKGSSRSYTGSRVSSQKQ